MKPIFVIFFLLIILASAAFVMVYNYSPELVEAHPEFFAGGLVCVMMVSMGGMMYSLISASSVPRVRSI